MRSIVFKIVFGGFLFLLQNSSSLYAQVIDEIIAKVDNQIVLKSELEASYLQVLKSDASVTDIAELKCRVLESLIINKLLLAKAEIDSVVVEKAMVDDQLDRRMQYFIDQVGNEKKLEEMYGKSMDVLKDELRKQVKDQMVIQKMQDNITSKIKATPAEIKKYFSEIPKDSLPYFSTEVEVGQIVKYPEVGRAQKLEARTKLEKIRERILAGEDFCKLAEQFSDDPGSGKDCGNLGFFKKGELVPSYEAAAYKLKPGEYSGIIETSFGFHFIQLIERKANEINTRHILIKPTSSKTDLGGAEQFLDSLRRRISADSLDFEKASKDHSDDKQTQINGGFLQDPKTGTSKIAVENLDPAIFFIIDTMKVGNITKPLPFRTEDGTEALRIIYYKSKTAPHQANLKDDYQKIFKAALGEKKNNAMEEWFDKTKGEVFIDIDDEYKNCQILITQ